VTPLWGLSPHAAPSTLPPGGEDSLPMSLYDGRDGYGRRAKDKTVEIAKVG